MLLRVGSKWGRCRIEAETLKSLKEKIQQKFNLPEDASIVLTKDSGGTLVVSGRDTDTLSRLGFTDGQEIFAHSRSQPVQSQAGYSLTQSTGFVSQTSEGFKSQTSGVTSRPPPTSGPNRATARPATTSPGTSGQRPKSGQRNYETFESYLDKTDFDLTHLPLMSSRGPVRKLSSSANRLPGIITLKHQSYRTVDHIEMMNVNAFQSFTKNWFQDLEMLKQRCAWLIGYYIDDPHYGAGGTRAVVEAIYEPTDQVSTPDLARFADTDTNLPAVETIAARLGMEIVGWMFTHLPRERLITAQEALYISRYIHTI